jgi:hypothetical protein
MKSKAALLASFLLLYTFSAQAADVTMVPSIGYGQSHLNFDRSTGESDVSQFNIIDLGMTASYGRYFVKVSSEMPLGEEYTYGPALVRQFKREDFGVTAGYYFRDDLSVFGGYSYGKTSIITFDGSSTTPHAIYTQHRDSGPFIGANYSIFVGKTATIGLNVAYANMDGEFIIQDSDPGGYSTNQSGTTDGFSFGATWSDTYKNKVTYYVAYKVKNYKTDLVTQSVDKTFNIVSFGFIFPI